MTDLYAIMGDDDLGNYGIVAISLNDKIMPCVSAKIELINDLMAHIVKEKRGSGRAFELVKYTRDMVIERRVA